MKEETESGGEGQGLMVEYMHLDLASLDSVRLFSSTLCKRDQSLHLLINNAGISWAHYGLHTLLVHLVLCTLRIKPFVCMCCRIDRGWI